ncbi:hypothetical protein BC832DRAFT_593344 [Gaertneriomyces semiglobifer]|nr:hypothetical protein BC832DRAFT_593344 [Gaertneriomyces semiglobifer]
MPLRNWVHPRPENTTPTTSTAGHPPPPSVSTTTAAPVTSSSIRSHRELQGRAAQHFFPRPPPVHRHTTFDASAVSGLVTEKVKAWTDRARQTAARTVPGGRGGAEEPGKARRRSDESDESDVGISPMPDVTKEREIAEGMWMGGSRSGYPEPKFSELEIKLVKSTPYNKQHWYSWDRLRRASFKGSQATTTSTTPATTTTTAVGPAPPLPHEKDRYELLFTHTPTGTHWTLSMRPKDFARFAAMLKADPKFKKAQRWIKRKAGLEPAKRELGVLTDGSHGSNLTATDRQHDGDEREVRPTQLPRLPRNTLDGEKLVEYLRQVLNVIIEPWNIPGDDYTAVDERRKGVIVCGFIELSRTSLVGTWGGEKGKEGWAKKRRGGRKNDVFCFPDILVPRTTQRRWLALRSNYLLYFYTPSDITPQEVLLIDGYFQVLHKNLQKKEQDLRPKDADPTGDEEDKVSTRPGGRHHHDRRNAMLLRPFNKKTNEIWVQEGHHLAVLNGFRDLLITVSADLSFRCRTHLAEEWARQLAQRREETSWFRQVQFDVGRYDSFAPVRRGLHSECVRWMVDGSAHFEQVFHAINIAQKEILIADWFITPELYLVRGADGIHRQHLPTRLDRLLFRKANQGVRIYILLYKEMNLPNASLHAKDQFMGRRTPSMLVEGEEQAEDGEMEGEHWGLTPQGRERIVVLRHPDQGRGYIGPVLDTVMWAHHEKAMVVDRKYAFIGGIDLCVGRYDTAEHTLRDDVIYDHNGSETSCGACQEDRQDNYAPGEGSGVDRLFNNEGGNAKEAVPAVADATKLFRTDEEGDTSGAHGNHVPAAAEHAEVPRSSSSASVHDTTTGSAHPESRFTAHPDPELLAPSKPHNIHKHQEALVGLTEPLRPTEGALTAEQGMDADAPKRGMSRYLEDRDASDSKPVANVFPGQDYSNPRIKDFYKLGEKPMDTLIERCHTARMPWHDIGCMFWKRDGEEDIEGPVDDLVWHFIQRWNFAKWEKKKRDFRIPWLYPSQGLRKLQEGDPKGTLELQVLRSASQWSAGSPREKSINNAYVNLIRHAKHYVYIENQFFITRFAPLETDKDHHKHHWFHHHTHGQKLPISKVDIHNPIAAVLIQRILEAHRKGETFRAFIVIPLLPAFYGDVRKSNADPALPYVLSAQTECVRGVIDELVRGGVPKERLRDYVMFVGLRKWSVLGKRLVTEQVYVHAKLLIVDDTHCLIGSANINDRSQMGSRDSELAILMHDTKPVKTVMGGKPYEASRVVHTLRVRLMHEHLGIPFRQGVRDVYDPISVTNLSSLSSPGTGDMDEDMSQFSDPRLFDPISEACHRLWLDTLTTNTVCFRHVFHVVPDDTVKTWHDYTRFVQTWGGAEEEKVEEGMGELSKEQGVLKTRTVDWVDTDSPYDSDEDMSDVLGRAKEDEERGQRPKKVSALELLETQVHGQAVHFPIKFLEKEELSVLFRGLTKLAPRRVFT